MRWKIKSLSLFTRKAKSINSANTTAQSQKDLQLSRWFQNITDLPLSRFIDCLVDNNLYALVITGTPSESELAEAWGNIRIQYADAMKDNEYRLYVTTQRQVTELQLTLQMIAIAVEELRKFYTVQFHNRLNKIFSFKFNLDPSKPEEYDAELEKAVRRSKGFSLDLNIKSAVLAGLEARMKGKGGNPTREYFESVLISLSDDAGYQLSKDMTVFVFAERVRRLITKHQSVKEKKNAK